LRDRPALSPGGARQTIFGRVEELIDEVLLDADVAREHVDQEALRQVGAGPHALPV